MKTKEVYKLKLREIRFYGGMVSKIIKIGLPTGIQNIVIALSNVIIQSGINSFGAVVMAGFTSYVKIDGFNFLPLMSFSMAATTFTGQNIGAGKWDRVREGFHAGLKLVWMLCVPLVLLYFFGGQDFDGLLPGPAHGAGLEQRHGLPANPVAFLFGGVH